MAYLPAVQLSTPYEDFPGYWLKTYTQGTTIPLSMATDAAAGTLLAKAEVSSGGTVPIGFIKTAGDAIFQPYLNAAYDAWLFPTEADADVNDTSNAILIADNVDLQSTEETLSAKFNKAFDTVALMVADTDLVLGDVVDIAGRLTTGDGGDNSFLIVAAGTGTADGGSFIDLPNVLPAALQAQGLFPRAIVNIRQFGAAPSATNAANFAAMQAAHDAFDNVHYTAGDYTIDDEIIIPNSNTVITMDSSVKITQATIDKAILKITGKDNVFIFCNGAILFGEGSWSSGWTGNSGHNDRVVQFITCTNCGISNPVIKNGANAGLSLTGCSSFIGSGLIIEGTHTHGVPLSPVDNFQNGVFIKHDAILGDCQDIMLDFDISGTAQGVLVEVRTGFTAQGDNVSLRGIVHDIPGQHGLYIQSGGVSVDVVARNCHLDGCKIQTNAANQPLRNCVIKVAAEGCGSAALEVQDADGNSTVENVIADVTANNCNRGLSVNQNIKSSVFTVSSTNSTGHGVIVQGPGNEDLDLYVTVNGSGQNGIQINSPDPENVVFHSPNVRESNTSAGTFDGILVTGTTSGSVIITDPVVTDSGNNQRYALFVETVTAAAKISVRGRGIFTGGTSITNCRANIELEEWVESVTLDGTTVESFINPNNFNKSPRPINTSIQSTSGSNVELYQKPLPDESAFWFTFDIVGKLAGSAERRGTQVKMLVYRDGGGSATLEGAAQVVSNVASGSFAGVITTTVIGNNARVAVHSGSAVNYDWACRASYVDVTD